MAMRVFFSCAHADERLRDELAKHLDILESQGLLRGWHEGLIKPGEVWCEAIDAQLLDADVVLLVISADFLSSPLCRDVTERALALQRAGRVRVIPVLARPCLWDSAPFAFLDPLPKNRRPVTLWENLEEAWDSVARSVRLLAQGQREASPLDVALVRKVDPSEQSTSRHENRAEREHLLCVAQLEDALTRRRLVVNAGETAVDIDEEIIKLKRQLREGGQLRQGDILGGRYSLLRRVGRGGFATVWEAEDREQHVRVAVKVLHADLAGDVKRRGRFFRGARIMAELDHEAIVRILVPEEKDGGFHYFVMELLNGGDLEAMVLAGRIPAGCVEPMIARVGRALNVAHERGFFHRDVKPANILLDKNGEPKLGDFDLVGGKETTGGTGTGAMGSFVYAAPEMLSRPQDADQRADVFGLGMTALFCLYKRKLPDVVFRNPERVIAEIGHPRLQEVITKAIEWDPANRFNDIPAFLTALRAARQQGADGQSPSHTENTPSHLHLPRDKSSLQGRIRLIALSSLLLGLTSFLFVRYVRQGSFDGPVPSASIADKSAAHETGLDVSQSETGAPPASGLPKSPQELSSSPSDQPGPSLSGEVTQTSTPSPEPVKKQPIVTGTNSKPKTSQIAKTTSQSCKSLHQVCSVDADCCPGRQCGFWRSVRACL